MPRTPWNAGRISAVLVLVILKLVLLWVVIPRVAGEDYMIGHFPDEYDHIAETLLAGDGYRFTVDTSPTLLRAPGFVLVLAAIFAVFGKQIAVVQACNVLFSLATIFLTLRLADRMLGPRGPAFHGLLFLAFFFHPATVFSESRGGVECFFTLSLTLFVFLLYRALDEDSLAAYAWAGIALGGTLLIRSTTVLVAPALLLYFVVVGWRERPRLPRRLSQWAMMAVLAGVVLTPWVVRNYRLLGEIRPTMTVKGFTAYQGYYLNKHYSLSREPWEIMAEASVEQNRIAASLGFDFKAEYFQHFRQARDEVRFYEHLFDLVIAEYVRSPGLLVKSVALNGLGFWFQGRTWKSTVLNTILTLPLLVLVVVGAMEAWRGGGRLLPLAVIFAAFYLPHLPLLGLARYHVPLLPLLLPFACLPPLRLWRSWTGGAK